MILMLQLYELGGVKHFIVIIINVVHYKYPTNPLFECYEDLS